MEITATMRTVVEKLLNSGCTYEGAFGVLGNLYAESGVVANNLENYYAQKWGITDEEYTQAVDDGRITRSSFINDGAGYGLAQWTYYSRKAGLYDMSKNNRRSIGDAEMQTEYLVIELKSFEDVWETITESHNLKECSDIVLVDFERPADQSEANKLRRYNIAKELMDSYNPTPVPDTAREKIVTTADYYVGCVQYDERHRRIIDIYNSHIPRARGYKMSYSDEWCAAFASGVYIEAGYADYFPLEVGCGKMVDKAKEMGIWVEDDNFVPSIGDGLMYNFDGKPGEETDHGADHVGLVVYVADGKIHTVEGNMGNGYCGTRTLAVGDEWIRGFIHVKLPEDPEPPTPPVPPEPPTPTGDYCEVKALIIGIGDEGNAVKTLQGALQAHGYDLEPWGGADGIFGAGTERRVKEYQDDHDLDVDGVVGEQTWSALCK